MEINCVTMANILPYHLKRFVLICLLFHALAVFHLGFKRGMAPPIIWKHLIMNAGYPVDRGGHFQHQPNQGYKENQLSV